MSVDGNQGVSSLEKGDEGFSTLQKKVMKVSVPSKNGDEGVSSLQRAIKVSVPSTWALKVSVPSTQLGNEGGFMPFPRGYLDLTYRWISISDQ